MKRSSTRSLSRVPKRKDDLWSDSDVSSADDLTVTPMSSTFKPIPYEHHRSIQTQCCLVCSILPSLSQVNCCSQHLSALTGTPLRPFVYIMRSGDHRSDKSVSRRRLKRCAELRSPSNSSVSSSSTIRPIKKQHLKKLPTCVRHRSKTATESSPSAFFRGTQRIEVGGCLLSGVRFPRRTCNRSVVDRFGEYREIVFEH